MVLSQNMKYVLIFAAGIAVGVIGSSVVRRGNLSFKSCAADVVSRGMDVKEAVAGAVERVKEDAADLMAEAKEIQTARKS